MIKNIADLHGFVIQAQDGDIGTVEQTYFDDETWTIRYLTADTGGWLNNRQVLLSPYSVTRIDWDAKRVTVALTKKQITNSPEINTQEPVSRRHEAEYLSYFGYPNYWGSPYLWGPGASPSGLNASHDSPAEAIAYRIQHASTESHLRVTQVVTGYTVEAVDGEIGHIDAFLVDDQTWAIRYVEVATRNWWPGKKVLVSPSWVQRVSWAESKIFIDLPREAIKGAPAYDETVPLVRAHEDTLYQHYSRPGYWKHQDPR